MNVLVVGGGAREHALTWKALQSPLTDTVFCAPGNAATGSIAINTGLEATDVEGVARFVNERDVGLTVIGPEVAVAAGLAARLTAAGRIVFGPTQAAGRIESSKAFAKSLMERTGVPTPAHRVFDNPASAKDFVRGERRAFVVKADGLAKGKGTLVARDAEETLECIDTLMLRRTVGGAADRIVMEENIDGRGGARRARGGERVLDVQVECGSGPRVPRVSRDLCHRIPDRRVGHDRARGSCLPCRRRGRSIGLRDGRRPGIDPRRAGRIDGRGEGPCLPERRSYSLSGDDLSPRPRGARDRSSRAAVSDGPLVGIVMGSESDRPTIQRCCEVLDGYGVTYEVVVRSAHRDPEGCRQWATEAEGRGINVLVAAAGGAAHLPGVVAAWSVLPVIGVPMSAGALGGLDALLSMAQMPAGIPVATVAIGDAGARNAGHLAVGILALADAGAREKLVKRREANRQPKQ